MRRVATVEIDPDIVRVISIADRAGQIPLMSCKGASRDDSISDVKGDGYYFLPVILSMRACGPALRTNELTSMPFGMRIVFALSSCADTLSANSKP